MWHIAHRTVNRYTHTQANLPAPSPIVISCRVPAPRAWNLPAVATASAHDNALPPNQRAASIGVGIESIPTPKPHPERHSMQGACTQSVESPSGCHRIGTRRGKEIPQQW